MQRTEKISFITYQLGIILLLLILMAFSEASAEEENIYDLPRAEDNVVIEDTEDTLLLDDHDAMMLMMINRKKREKNWTLRAGFLVIIIAISMLPWPCKENGRIICTIMMPIK
ncbi:MAG: hypothetical protein D3915_01495 [Candidatus Electrothrix sp. AU1_5]|nr:hypothetical protein [Candidatus Electrothrix gigas]